MTLTFVFASLIPRTCRWILIKSEEEWKEKRRSKTGQAVKMHCVALVTESEKKNRFSKDQAAFTTRSFTAWRFEKSMHNAFLGLTA